MVNPLLAPLLSTTRRALRCATAVALLTAGQAFAVPVTVHFSGYVTEVQSDSWNLLGGQVAYQTRFTGGLTYETDTPNTHPNPGFGYFANAVQAMWLKFDPVASLFSMGGAQTYNNVQTADDRIDYGAPKFDGFYAYSQWDASAVADSAGAYSEIGLSAHSNDLSALSGAALPMTLPLGKFIDAADPESLDPGGLTSGDVNGNKADFLGAWMEFHLLSTGTERSTHVYGVIDSATVPEPSTGLLTIVGLLAFGALRRRPGSSSLA